MSKITDLITYGSTLMAVNAPNAIWNKMINRAKETDSRPYLGGSKLYEFTTATEIGEAISEVSVRGDPLKFSKAKYHGYIKNLDTQEIRKFQFNPENFSYSRGVTYTDSISPGMSYPETQFSHGNAREFEVELFMYDPYCIGIIKEYINFLGAFLTIERNLPDYRRPPELLFYYGYFIRRCVMTNLDISHEWLDEQGTPLMTRFKLTLRQVGVSEL